MNLKNLVNSKKNIDKNGNSKRHVFY